VEVKTKGVTMFKLFRRGPAAEKLKRYILTNVASMAITFEATYFGRSLNQIAMDKVSMVIIVASLMKAGLNGRRIQTCVYEVAADTEMDLNDIGVLPGLAEAVLPELSGSNAIESRLQLMRDILPGYPFERDDTVWFDTNILILLEKLSTELREIVNILE
jgi:hypothetical protein